MNTITPGQIPVLKQEIPGNEPPRENKGYRIARITGLIALAAIGATLIFPLGIIITAPVAVISGVVSGVAFLGGYYTARKVDKVAKMHFQAASSVPKEPPPAPPTETPHEPEPVVKAMEEEVVLPETIPEKPVEPEPVKEPDVLPPVVEGPVLSEEMAEVYAQHKALLASRADLEERERVASQEAIRGMSADERALHMFKGNYNISRFGYDTGEKALELYRSLDESTLQQIERLGLSGVDIDDKSLKEIVSLLPNLKELNLRDSVKVTPEGVRAIAPLLQNLEYLNLRYCPYINQTHTDVAEAFGKNVKVEVTRERGVNRAEANTIHHTHFISDRRGGHWNYERGAYTPEDLARAISEKDYPVRRIEEYKSAADVLKFFSFLGADARHIQSLNLSETRINDEGLKEILTKVPNLQHLDLSKTHITDASIEHILEHAPHIQSLKLNFAAVTPESIIQAAPLLKNLKLLELNGCVLFEERHVRDITEAFSQKDIEIKGGSFNPLAAWEAALTRREIEFEALKKSSNFVIPTSEGYLEFYDFPEAKFIESVRFNNSPIDDETLAKLLQSMPNLRVLHLKNCQNISDKSLAHIAEYAPQLEMIDLSRTKITAEAIISAAPSLTKLKAIQLDNCENIKTNQMKSIKQAFSQSENLSAQYNGIYERILKDKAIGSVVDKLLAGDEFDGEIIARLDKAPWRESPLTEEQKVKLAYMLMDPKHSDEIKRSVTRGESFIGKNMVDITLALFKKRDARAFEFAQMPILSEDMKKAVNSNFLSGTRIAPVVGDDADLREKYRSTPEEVEYSMLPWMEDSEPWDKYSIIRGEYKVDPSSYLRIGLKSAEIAPVLTARHIDKFQFQNNHQRMDVLAWCLFHCDPAVRDIVEKDIVRFYDAQEWGESDVSLKWVREREQAFRANGKWVKW